MAQSKLDLFFTTPGGFDGHLELVPGEGESAMALLEQADSKLKAMGCQPRPVPGRNGRQGGGPAQPKETANCPECGASATIKAGISRKTNKPFRLLTCSACGLEKWLKAS